MARRSSIRPLREISEINMTPLIDLTFLLLITFIITMPLLEQGIPVNLPKGRAQDMDTPVSRTITLDAEGRIYLEKVSVTLSQLGEQMKALAQAEPSLTVMVRADERLQYGKVVEVMRALYEANVTRLGLVTTPDAPARR
ncbi:MAG: biopolymer transporter ExbD [Kiritimatiellae bacterium]|nr:biopolymer transporter ExbD [Kiritimatiellia bacterium]MDW8458563.1 biopolymer transporter ExbD [Verrucomicrobiota bacterium]